MCVYVCGCEHSRAIRLMSVSSVYCVHACSSSSPPAQMDAWMQGIRELRGRHRVMMSVKHTSFSVNLNVFVFVAWCLVNVNILASISGTMAHAIKQYLISCECVCANVCMCVCLSSGESGRCTKQRKKWKEECMFPHEYTPIRCFTRQIRVLFLFSFHRLPSTS